MKGVVRAAKTTPFVPQGTPPGRPCISAGLPQELTPPAFVASSPEFMRKFSLGQVAELMI